MAIAISLPYFFLKREGFVLPVQLISISIFISIIVAHFSWEQSWSDSILATLPYMLWPVFFYLKHLKYPIETLEKLIVIFGIIYIILYFFQLAHSDTVYFGWDEELDLSRGIARIVFPGGGVFYLTIFIALSKFSSQNQHRWFWLILLIMGIVITVLQVTRQYIAVVLLIYIFHFIKDQKFYKKVIISASFIGLLVYISQSDNPVVRGLRSIQQETVSEGKDYIRVKSGIYFLTDFSPSIINRIVGNGFPYGDKSEYGRVQQSLNEINGFYLSDVGLIAFYAMFGVLAVFGYFLIWMKSFTLKLPKKYYYLKYYLWFLLLTCLTSDSIYTYKYLIATVFVLYCYQTVYEEESLNSEERLELE